MRALNLDTFADLIQLAHVKARLRRELRFTSSTDSIPTEEWPELELVAVSDRSGNEGVLLIELDAQLYVVPYELSIRMADLQTGRSKPVICDICNTWQSGANSARITFTHTKSLHKIGFLCCADLACSRHVRSKTKASILSRTQLHEDLNNAQRVDRLKRKLQGLAERLDLQPVSIERTAG